MHLTGLSTVSVVRVVLQSERTMRRVASPSYHTPSPCIAAYPAARAPRMRCSSLSSDDENDWLDAGACSEMRLSLVVHAMDDFSASPTHGAWYLVQRLRRLARGGGVCVVAGEVPVALVVRVHGDGTAAQLQLAWWRCGGKHVRQRRAWVLQLRRGESLHESRPGVEHHGEGRVRGGVQQLREAGVHGHWRCGRMHSHSLPHTPCTQSETERRRVGLEE